MKKSLIVLFGIFSSISLAHANLTVKNENVPLELLSPDKAMVGSIKAGAALFLDLPKKGESRTYNVSGNYFNFMILPTGQAGVGCYLNKEDSKATPYVQLKGVDVPANKNTEIAFTWAEGEDHLQCTVTQK